MVGFNFMLCFYCSRGVHCRCLYIGTMEGKLELFSQGMQSSWFMSGMGVPGSKVGWLCRGPREGYICLGGINDGHG